MQPFDRAAGDVRRLVMPCNAASSASASHGRDENILLVTLGLSIIIENLSLFVFKSDTRVMTHPIPSRLWKSSAPSCRMPKVDRICRRLDHGGALLGC
jgi:hypothetical protein